MKFGGSGIDKIVYDHILKILPKGKTIVELGSGAVSTQILSQSYKLYSVEDDKKYFGLFNSTYIHAPIKRYSEYGCRWYDANSIKNGLPQLYDLLLIDGPTGSIGRYGLFYHLGLFKADIPWIIHDTNGEPARKLAIDTAAKQERLVEFFETFAVIWRS